MSLAERRVFAEALLALLRPFSIPLIINDDALFAKEIGADGVHLGQEDGAPTLARKLLGEGKMIGQSIESWEELEHANQCDALDYVAASAVFPTKNKSNVKNIWGIEGLTALAQASCHPLIAIGGINRSNIMLVKIAGAAGVAVIGALHEAQEPTAMAKQLLSIMKGNDYECCTA
jgi:thiamine-phosphate pyrophosphorylase